MMMNFVMFSGEDPLGPIVVNMTHVTHVWPHARNPRLVGIQLCNKTIIVVQSDMGNVLLMLSKIQGSFLPEVKSV